MKERELARITVRDKSCEGDSLLIDADEMTGFLIHWDKMPDSDIFKYRKSKEPIIFMWKDANSMRLLAYEWHSKTKSRESLRIVAVLDALNCYKNSWVEIQYL